MYSSEYTSGFSGPAASHLAAPPSPRHERQCRTGSLQDAEKVRRPVLFVWSVRSVWSVSFNWFVWFVLFIWLNQINRINQMNQINKTNQITRQTGLVSDRWPLEVLACRQSFSAACWSQHGLN